MLLGKEKDGLAEKGLAHLVYSDIIDDGNIICLKWKDKRMVHMISTFHIML